MHCNGLPSSAILQCPWTSHLNNDPTCLFYLLIVTQEGLLKSVLWRSEGHIPAPHSLTILAEVRKQGVLVQTDFVSLEDGRAV